MKQLIKYWKKDIENISVEGWKREVTDYTINITGNKDFDEKIITFNLGDLKNFDKTIDDYSHKFYSIWGHNLINSFIEKLKGDDEFTPSPNWTEITFKNDFADWILYNTFTFRVSVFNPLKILRDEKLKELGL